MQWVGVGRVWAGPGQTQPLLPSGKLPRGEERRYMRQAIRLHEISTINRYEFGNWWRIPWLIECRTSLCWCEGEFKLVILCRWPGLGRDRGVGIIPFKLDNVSPIQTSDMTGGNSDSSASLSVSLSHIQRNLFKVNSSFILAILISLGSELLDGHSRNWERARFWLNFFFFTQKKERR